MNPRINLFAKVLFLSTFNLILASLDENRTVTCNDGTSILTKSLCDEIADCGDGSDENYLGRGFKCKLRDNKRNCVIPESIVRDNVPDCIDESDLCFDELFQLITHRCFQCLNGYQTLALHQVCDGVMDCDDFSDECLCMNNGVASPSFFKSPICDQIHMADKKFVESVNEIFFGPCDIGEFVCSSENQEIHKFQSFSTVQSNMFQNSTCLMLSKVCDGVPDCPNADDESFCPQTMKCTNDNSEATSCDGRITCSDFSDECNSKCWHQPEYCEFVKDDQFHCIANNKSTLTNTTNNFNLSANYKHVCNSAVDCDLGSNDERFCSVSSHFYCWSGKKLFVNQSLRFNEVMDCEDGSDECSGMFMFTNDIEDFFRRNDIVRHPILQILIWIVAVIALTGNISVIIFTSRELWMDRHTETLGKLAKCNRSFVLHLAVADLMMGVPLLVIAIQGAVLSNNYCTSDRTWRSGGLCVMMGMLTQCSSQTAVFLLLLMTSYRLYGTLHPFRVEESKLMGGATTATFAVWFISISLTVIPQARFASDFFTERYWFPLPFLNHDLLNRSEMEELVLNMFSLSHNTSSISLPDLRWNTMIDYLWHSDLTASHPSWNGQNIVPIGFYNRYPLCQPFFYPNVGDTGWLYMTAIVLFNFLAFVYIAIAYLVIYKASSRPCVRKSVRRRSKQWRQDNRKMQRKIFCLVFTDMACWLPICVIMVAKLLEIPMHPVIYGITGVILLPINSALNPIVYSSVFSNFLRGFCKKKSPFDPPSSSNDATISIKGSIGSLLNIKTLVNGSPGIGNNNKQPKKKFSKELDKSKKRRVRFSSESSSKESLFDNLNEPTFSTDNRPTRDSIQKHNFLETSSKNDLKKNTNGFKSDMKESKI